MVRSPAFLAGWPSAHFQPAVFLAQIVIGRHRLDGLIIGVEGEALQREHGRAVGNRERRGCSRRLSREFEL